MAMQFLVEANRNIRTQLTLPAFFTERWYPKERWIYLIHNNGTKHMVYWKMVRGHVTLYSHEWKAFWDDSKYQDVAMLHFIREEEDYYYVTGYNNEGCECNGYNVMLEGYRQRRCLVTLGQGAQSMKIPCGFLQIHENPRFRVLIGGNQVARVTHHKIDIVDEDVEEGEPVPHIHVFAGHDWMNLIAAENIIPGTIIVFTNLLNNTVSLMPFDEAGFQMHEEPVDRMPVNWRKPFVLSPVETKEKRIKHMCEWEGHTEHADQKDCFYAPMVAYVTDRGRLNIPHDFVKAHDMWKYHNAILRYMDEEFKVDVDLEYHSDRPKSKNHVTLKCRWKAVVLACQWIEDKMVRFKLVGEVQDNSASVSSSQPVMIPVFHMC